MKKRKEQSKKKFAPFLVRSFYSLLVIFIFCSCSEVKVFEKGILAKPQMGFDPYPLQSRKLRHIEESKEGTLGGYGVTAGGCGCN